VTIAASRALETRCHLYTGDDGRTSGTGEKPVSPGGDDALKMKSVIAGARRRRTVTVPRWTLMMREHPGREHVANSRRECGVGTGPSANTAFLDQGEQPEALMSRIDGHHVRRSQLPAP